MIDCTISHCDTCLPDYANRSYAIAVPVDGATTIGEVIEYIANDEPLGCDEWTAEQSAAFDAAVRELRADNVRKLKLPFDPSLDAADMDAVCEAGESVYAYFDVEFDTE